MNSPWNATVSLHPTCISLQPKGFIIPDEANQFIYGHSGGKTGIINPLRCTANMHLTVPVDPTCRVTKSYKFHGPGNAVRRTISFLKGRGPHFLK